MNRVGLLASGVGEAIVAAVAWHVGVPPLMFWAVLATIGAAVAIVRLTKKGSQN